MLKFTHKYNIERKYRRLCKKQNLKLHKSTCIHWVHTVTSKTEKNCNIGKENFDVLDTAGLLSLQRFKFICQFDIWSTAVLVRGVSQNGHGLFLALC